MSVNNNVTITPSATTKSNPLNTKPVGIIHSKRNVQLHLNKNLMSAFDKHIEEFVLQRSKVVEILIAEYLNNYQKTKDTIKMKTDYRYLFDGTQT